MNVRPPFHHEELSPWHRRCCSSFRTSSIAAFDVQVSDTSLLNLSAISPKLGSPENPGSMSVKQFTLCRPLYLGFRHPCPPGTYVENGRKRAGNSLAFGGRGLQSSLRLFLSFYLFCLLASLCPFVLPLSLPPLEGRGERERNVRPHIPLQYPGQTT